MVDKINPANDPRELLRRLCAERGEDFAGLSRLIGRNSAYIQQFIRRGTPRRLPERERRILARHFGISEEALGGEAAARSFDGFVAPLPLDEEGSASIAFSAEWIGRLTGSPPDMLRLMRVEGEAMAPSLNAGDELLVDLSDGAGALRDGLYVLAVKGSRQVRRLTMHPLRREVTVQSDNPSFADWPGLSPDDLQLVGRVLWAGRRFA